MSGLKPFRHQAISERISRKISLEIAEKSKLVEDMASERFNRPVKVFEVLAKAAARGMIRITVPESLIRLKGEMVSLYTDKEGVLRVRSGPESKIFFVQYCRVLGKKVKMSNPMAIHYPKYVTFSKSGAQYTLRHKSNIETAWNSSEMIQRFIPSSGFNVSKTILHWSRVKSTKKHCITSRADMRVHLLAKDLAFDSDPQHPSALSLDLPFVASLQHLDSCEVEKVKRIQEEEMELLQTVRSALEREELAPEEQLEEMVVSYITGLDGQRYFLNCTKVLVKLRSVNLFRRSSLPELMLSRPLAKLPSLPLEKAPLKASVQAEPSCSYAKSKCFFAIAAEHLSNVMMNMEKMRLSAQKQKEQTAKLRFEA